MQHESTWSLGEWQYQVWTFPYVFQPKLYPREP